MKQWISWLRFHENKLLIWANRRLNHTFGYRFLHRWMSIITHLGGATFTISCSLIIGLLGKDEISVVGWKCLLALGLSHIPVAILKYKFKRLRPYQALPDVNTGVKPLEDPSFPSGHTTAIFAFIMPIVLSPALFPAILIGLLFIIAGSVAWSRMYLGLHYPSDVLVGATIGTLSAYIIHYIWQTPIY